MVVACALDLLRWQWLAKKALDAAGQKQLIDIRGYAILMRISTCKWSLLSQ